MLRHKEEQWLWNQLGVLTMNIFSTPAERAVNDKCLLFEENKGEKVDGVSRLSCKASNTVSLADT